MTAGPMAVIVIAVSIGSMAGGAAPVMARLHDPRLWGNDGGCDEPNGLNLCAPGTDIVDCSDPTANSGTGSGYAGGQHRHDGAGLVTRAPWQGESNDGRSHATQPRGVTPLNAHGPVTAPGPGWGLMDGVCDIYSARSNG